MLQQTPPTFLQNINLKKSLLKQRTPYHVNTISSKCLHSLLETTKYKDKKANVILRQHQRHSDLAKFLHDCCDDPVVSTFITAIKNNQFITWPGLTANLILNHLPPSRETTKGNLHHELQHLQSMKKTDNNTYLQNIRYNIARIKCSIKGNVNLQGLLEKYIKHNAFPSPPTLN